MKHGVALHYGYAGTPHNGRLWGSTVTAGAPDAPVSRVVHLLSGASARGMIGSNASPVRWMQSDAQGNWQFDRLDPAAKYHVIAYDHTGQYDPVIKMNLVPTVD